MVATFPADPNGLPNKDWDPFFTGFYTASGSTVDNYPWMQHGATVNTSAQRNASRKHVVAKSLMKGIIAVLEGKVQSAWFDQATGTLWAEIRSKDPTSGAQVVSPCLLQTAPLKIMAPHHSPNKPNYYAGALFLLEGLAYQVPDLLGALEAVVKLKATYSDGKFQGTEQEQAVIVRLCDEVVYSMAFLDQVPSAATDRRRGPVDVIRTVANGAPTQDCPLVSDDALPLDIALVSRPVAWDAARTRGGTLLPRRANAHRYPPMPDILNKFSGHQARDAWEAIHRGKILYFGGPAGTGKTYLAQLLAIALQRRLIILPCTEVMDDVAVVGGILPVEKKAEWYDALLMALSSFNTSLAESKSRLVGGLGKALSGPIQMLLEWKPEIHADGRSFVYGPMGEALVRAGNSEKIVLLIDELRRLDPTHNVSFLHAFQPRDKLTVTAMGYNTGDHPGPFYVLPMPQHETLITPCENLVVIAASNEGAGYLLKKLDPAFRERFVYRIEFHSPSVDEAVRMILREVPGFDDPSMLPLATVMAKFAEWTQNAQLVEGFPGCVSPRTLLQWARDVAWLGSAAPIEQVWVFAKANFGDLVAGQNGQGFVLDDRWNPAWDQFEAFWVDAGLEVVPS